MPPLSLLSWLWELIKRAQRAAKVRSPPAAYGKHGARQRYEKYAATYAAPDQQPAPSFARICYQLPQPSVVDVAAWSNPDTLIMLIGLSQHRSLVSAPNVDFVDLEPLIEATREGFDSS